MSRKQKYSPLTPEQEYAILNEVVYTDKKDWNKELKKYGLDKKYKIDRRLSKDNTMILHNDDDKKLVVVHSGTDLSRRAGEDLLTDAFIGLDLTRISPRYKKSKDLTQKAISKYEGYTPISTGFSLGGAVSSQLSNDLKIESHSFNPGTSPLQIKGDLEQHITKKLLGKSKPSISNVYMTGNDWISASGFIDPNHNIKVVQNKKGEKPHSITNFYDAALIK